MGKSLITTIYNRGAWLESHGFHIEFTPDFRNLAMKYQPYTSEDDRVLFHFQLTTIMGLLGLGYWALFDGSTPTLLISLLFIMIPWGNTFINLPFRNEGTFEERIYGMEYFEGSIILIWGTWCKYIGTPWQLFHIGTMVRGSGEFKPISSVLPVLPLPNLIKVDGRTYHFLIYRGDFYIKGLLWFGIKTIISEHWLQIIDKKHVWLKYDYKGVKKCIQKNKHKL